MEAQLDLGGISVDVVFKDIKNVHLSVHPPTGRVRISAPERMKLDVIRIFAISKLDWIKRQQMVLQGQERETAREYLDRESHYLWGKRYLLQLIDTGGTPGVCISHKRMIVQTRHNANENEKRAIISQFYRSEIRTIASDLVSTWAPRMNVSVSRLFVRQMKTKWGSCNPRTRAIRLNTELAKKPKHCLEYVLVHEIAHILVRHHDDRFTALLDRMMPQWRECRDELNRLPLGLSKWNQQ